MRNQIDSSTAYFLTVDTMRGWWQLAVHMPVRAIAQYTAELQTVFGNVQQFRKTMQDSAWETWIHRHTPTHHLPFGWTITLPGRLDRSLNASHQNIGCNPLEKANTAMCYLWLVFLSREEGQCKKTYLCINCMQDQEDRVDGLGNRWWKQSAGASRWHTLGLWWASFNQPDDELLPSVDTFSTEQKYFIPFFDC